MLQISSETDMLSYESSKYPHFLLSLSSNSYYFFLTTISWDIQTNFLILCPTYALDGDEMVPNLFWAPDFWSSRLGQIR